MVLFLNLYAIIYKDGVLKRRKNIMSKKVNMQNNYVKLGMILIVVVLVTLIGANLYNNIVRRQTESGHLTSRVLTMEYNEINNILIELSGDTFIYISYTGNRDIYNLDVRLRRIIDEQKLNDQFIYLNMIDYMKNNNYLEELNEKLSLTEFKIRALPAILYYRDNQLVQIIDSYNQLLNSGDFTHLLERYEIIQR